jgi:predicted GNAT family N-acyltransferase
MKAFVIKTQEQLDACLAIRRQVFVEEQGVPIELEIDDWDQLNAGTHILLQDDSGESVATARLKRYDETTAKVQRVAVLKRVRGRGYGKSVMQAIEEEARNLGFTSVILDAQLHAQDFYKKLGYHVISERPFLDAGIEHVRMQKDIR